MNRDNPATAPDGTAQLLELLHRWIALAETGLSEIEEDGPESIGRLEHLMSKLTGLLEQGQRLQRLCGADPEQTPAMGPPASLAAELRPAAQRALAASRRIELAVRCRERFVASRLAVLLGAAGMPGIYSSAGSVQRATISGGTIITA